MRLRFFVILGIVGVEIAGCAVGPDFRQPEAPLTHTYTEFV